MAVTLKRHGLAPEIHVGKRAPRDAADCRYQIRGLMTVAGLAALDRSNELLGHIKRAIKRA